MAAFTNNTLSPQTHLSSSPWNMAMSALMVARAAEIAFDRKEWRPAYRAAKNGTRIPTLVDAEMERLQDARMDAEDVLFSTPAEDLTGVIWKMNYSRKRCEGIAEWSGNWGDGVAADLLRLSAAELRDGGL